MHVARYVLCCISCLTLLFPSTAQQLPSATTQPLQRDPVALTLVQQSLTAMGGSQAVLLGDSVATGEVQSFAPDGTSVIRHVVKKSKGTKFIRTEVQRPEGTRLVILNTGIGAIGNPDGTSRPLPSNNTVAARVEHIPALSILSEWQSSSIEIRYVRSDTLNDGAVHVIALSFIPTSDPKRVGLYRSITQTLVYIDQVTSFVSKIEYQLCADNDTNRSQKIEVFFTDYRLTNGVQVPFTQTSYADGRLRSTLTLTNVVFHTGLSDSDFSVPGSN